MRLFNKIIMKSKPTIALDFDGVIHRYSDGYSDGTIYDKPKQGTEQALKKLADKYRLVIHTTRTNKKDIWEWLKGFGLDNYIHNISNKKPKEAKLFIDDRAIRFKTWGQVLGEIKNSNIKKSYIIEGNDMLFKAFGKQLELFGGGQEELFTGQEKEGKKLLPSKKDPHVRRWQSEGESKAEETPKQQFQIGETIFDIMSGETAKVVDSKATLMTEGIENGKIKKLEKPYYDETYTVQFPDGSKTLRSNNEIKAIEKGPRKEIPKDDGKPYLFEENEGERTIYFKTVPSPEVIKALKEHGYKTDFNRRKAKREKGYKFAYTSTNKNAGDLVTKLDPDKEKPRLTEKQSQNLLKKLRGELKGNDVYSRNYRKITKIIPDIKDLASDRVLRLKSDGYMDLVVETLGYTNKGRQVVALGHYGEQNGDLMSDPRMDIAIDHEMEIVEALNWENHYMGQYREVYDDMYNPKKVNQREKKEQNKFLSMWLTNINNQGHKAEKEPIEKSRDSGRLNLFGDSYDQTGLFTGQEKEGKKLLPSGKNPQVRRWQNEHENTDTGRAGEYEHANKELNEREQRLVVLEKERESINDRYPDKDRILRNIALSSVVKAIKEEKSAIKNLSDKIELSRPVKDDELGKVMDMSVKKYLSRDDIKTIKRANKEQLYNAIKRMWTSGKTEKSQSAKFALIELARTYLNFRGKIKENIDLLNFRDKIQKILSDKSNDNAAASKKKFIDELWAGDEIKQKEHLEKERTEEKERREWFREFTKPAISEINELPNLLKNPVEFILNKQSYIKDEDISGKEWFKEHGTLQSNMKYGYNLFHALDMIDKGFRKMNLPKGHKIVKDGTTMIYETPHLSIRIRRKGAYPSDPFVLEVFARGEE